MIEIIARDPAAWERWLDANHETATEVWLVYWKKASAKQTVTWAEAVEVALKYGWIDGLIRPIDDQRYEAPTEAALGDLRSTIEEAISEGTSAQRKALMRALVASIKVDGRVVQQEVEGPGEACSCVNQPVTERITETAANGA